MWFEELTGFAEQSPDQVREKLVIEGTQMRSLVNDRTFDCGLFETPSLAELRDRVNKVDTSNNSSQKNRLSEIVADVSDLHREPRNTHAVFQAASQFNCLEMVSPEVTPERGVGIYQNDWTQGPACAIAAGAGTIFRNYFVPLGDQIGQTATRQIDCLSQFGDALGNSENRYWEMRNGYALVDVEKLGQLESLLNSASHAELDRLRSLVRIGMQWHTDVTKVGCEHQVSQAYCSGLPVGYCGHATADWGPFATLILEAAYEATLCSAMINRAEKRSDKLILTLLGGGVFENKESWIAAAMVRALRKFSHCGLDISIVSYGESQPIVQQIVHDVQV